MEQSQNIKQRRKEDHQETQKVNSHKNRITGAQLTKRRCQHHMAAHAMG
jgi:hypothetical protein